MTIFGTRGLYLCNNKNDKAMPKEFQNQIVNFSEIEALIDDLDLEFTGVE